MTHRMFTLVAVLSLMLCVTLTILWAMSYTETILIELIIGVPYWFLVLLTAAPPGCWVWHMRRLRKRPLAGQCLHCGYDLRATPDRCPECGTRAKYPAGTPSTPSPQ